MAQAEKQGDGRPTPAAGLYRHPVTGTEMIAVPTSKFGNPQGDAYVRLGFQYVGPVDKSDQAAVDGMADPHAETVPLYGVKSVSQLEAELAEAKAREGVTDEVVEEAPKKASKSK